MAQTPQELLSKQHLQPLSKGATAQRTQVMGVGAKTATNPETSKNPPKGETPQGHQHQHHHHHHHHLQRPNLTNYPTQLLRLLLQEMLILLRQGIQQVPPHLRPLIRSCAPNKKQTNSSHLIFLPFPKPVSRPKPKRKLIWTYLNQPQCPRRELLVLLEGIKSPLMIKRSPPSDLSSISDLIFFQINFPVHIPTSGNPPLKIEAHTTTTPLQKWWIFSRFPSHVKETTRFTFINFCLKWAALLVDGRNPAIASWGWLLFPLIYKVLYLPGGAGFLPSTVWHYHLLARGALSNHL